MFTKAYSKQLVHKEGLEMGSEIGMTDLILEY